MNGSAKLPEEKNLSWKSPKVLLRWADLILAETFWKSPKSSDKVIDLTRFDLKMGRFDISWNTFVGRPKAGWIGPTAESQSHLPCLKVIRPRVGSGNNNLVFSFDLWFWLPVQINHMAKHSVDHFQPCCVNSIFLKLPFSKVFSYYYQIEHLMKVLQMCNLGEVWLLWRDHLIANRHSDQD